MSRAFTKEDAQQDDVMVVARAPLPEGAENLVTLRGLALLQEEERLLADELAQAVSAEDWRRSAALEAAADELAQRLASAVPRDPAANDKQSVSFGDLVTLRPLKPGARAFSLRIVGVDEADPEADLISHQAPLSRALLGKRVGDHVLQGAPGAEREVAIEGID